MGRWLDLLGTTFSKLQIGIGGPFLKNNSGTLESRVAADNAYASMRALVIAATGDSIILNEQAGETGADWKFTISRPSSGMTEDIQVIMPAGAPSIGQALTVASQTSGVITMQWSSVTAGNQLISADTTTLAFGSTSPVTMYTAPANAEEYWFQITIDTPFTGGTNPTMSVGISGTTSKYVSSTQVDLTAPAGTVYEISPGVVPSGSSENLICTYSGGGSTAGSARIKGFYSIPS